MKKPNWGKKLIPLDVFCENYFLDVFVQDCCLLHQ